MRLGKVVLAALTSCALALGCCPAIDAETPIHFDREFTDLELVPMVSAVAEWAVAMDRDMPPMTYDEPHGWNAVEWAKERTVVHRMTEPETVLLRQLAVSGLWGKNFVGLTSSGGSIVIAIERLGGDPENLRRVMLHELWHRYGCFGHEDAPSLRVGTLGKDLPCIDAETIEDVCDVQSDGCGPNAGPTCPN